MKITDKMQPAAARCPFIRWRSLRPKRNPASMDAGSFIVNCAPFFFGVSNGMLLGCNGWERLIKYLLMTQRCYAFFFYKTGIWYLAGFSG
jgi:hypothetical protein